MTTKEVDNRESPMERLLQQLIPGIAALIVVVLGVYAAFFAFVHHARISSDPGDWGTLGDYFGGLLNPVVSFATLVVAYAVWKQQKEELKATKEALEEQAKTAEQQRQEQRFFDLLNVYYQTVASIRLEALPQEVLRSTVSVNEHLGKAAIQTWLKDRTPELWVLTENLGDYIATDAHLAYSIGFLKGQWEEHRGFEHFGPYLRTIESILATAMLVLKENQDRYIQLFRSQLSQSELVLIGVFLLMGDSASLRLKGLAELYGLLTHLSDSDLRTLLHSRAPAVLADPLAA